MKQKINDFFYYFFDFPLWAVLLFLIVALFVVIFFPPTPNHKQYEANCKVGTYQVYHDGFNYYLQETGEEFWGYGNCVFVETKQ